MEDCGIGSAGPFGRCKLPSIHYCFSTTRRDLEVSIWADPLIDILFPVKFCNHGQEFPPPIGNFMRTSILQWSFAGIFSWRGPDMATVLDIAKKHRYDWMA